jgi:hypothetical protein
MFYAFRDADVKIALMRLLNPLALCLGTMLVNILLEDRFHRY